MGDAVALPALNKLTAVFCACAVLGGCATSPHDGRAQLAAPQPMSALYSDVNLRFKLITTANAPGGCYGPECAAPDGFEQRLARIAPDLTRAAFQLYPDLRGRVENFEFIVADKSEAGTVSTSLGRIVVLRPVHSLAPTDAALAFIVAREMGHVIARHHEENTATSLIVSGIAQLLMPVANLARVFTSVFVPGAASVNGMATVAANASVTATSLVGSRVVITAYKPKQVEEADAVAMNLLTRLGYDAPAVATAFAPVDLKSPATDWTSDLRVSVERLSRQSPGRSLARQDLTAGDGCGQTGADRAPARDC